MCFLEQHKKASILTLCSRPMTISPYSDIVDHNMPLPFVLPSLGVYDWFFLLKYQGHKYKEVPFSVVVVYLQSLKDNMSQTHLSGMMGSEYRVRKRSLTITLRRQSGEKSRLDADLLLTSNLKLTFTLNGCLQ